MTEPEKSQTEKSTCPFCGGTGQLGFFGGVSRFHMSWEECYECNGTGYLENNPSDEKSEGTGEESDT